MPRMTLPSPRAPARPLCVLVVDDDPFILTLMRDMLQAAGLDDPGHAILTESDPLRGLERVTAARPDLLICDLSMPRMSGIEFLAAAGSAGYQGQVLVLSGMDQAARLAAEQMARAQGLRVIGAVHKPIALADLRAALASVA